RASDERGVAEAARVPSDRAITGGGELRYLLKPRGMRTAGAVRQQQCRRVVVTRNLVVDALAAGINRARTPPREFRHCDETSAGGELTTTARGPPTGGQFQPVDVAARLDLLEHALVAGALDLP